MSYKAVFISLGCAKNQIDCEQMMFRFQEAGFEILEGVDGADLVVINTCGFIDSAKSEAIDHIIAMGELKAQGRIGKILVTGCLAQRYQEQILQELPEVDGVLGTGNYFDAPAAAMSLLQGEGVSRFDDPNNQGSEGGRILTTPSHYAYLKIAEGCSNQCAYCVIPKLRGKYRSRRMEDILTEAEGLARQGIRELIVVAQDTTLYGVDLPGHKKRLPELLQKLCRIDGIHWVRVHYLYPEVMTDELIDVFAAEPKLVEYFDIPIQHINDEILRKMNRRGSKEYIQALFRKIREKVPNAVIRTSLIVGLPGEGEAEFAELCDFLQEYRLERAGVFAYSPEEGTPAEKMPRPDEATARRRAELVMEKQFAIMDEIARGQIGTRVEVLCEGYDTQQGLYYGRSRWDSPDIDNKVWFQSEKDIAPGSFGNITVREVRDGELMGTWEGSSHDNRV